MSTPTSLIIVNTHNELSVINAVRSIFEGLYIPQEIIVVTSEKPSNTLLAFCDDHRLVLRKTKSAQSNLIESFLLGARIASYERLIIMRSDTLVSPTLCVSLATMCNTKDSVIFAKEIALPHGLKHNDYKTQYLYVKKHEKYSTSLYKAPVPLEMSAIFSITQSLLNQLPNIYSEITTDQIAQEYFMVELTQLISGIKFSSETCIHYTAHKSNITASVETFVLFNDAFLFKKRWKKWPKSMNFDQLIKLSIEERREKINTPIPRSKDSSVLDPIEMRSESTSEAC